MEKAKVYFTKEIAPQAVVRMYEAMGVKLPGRVAVKLHSGEVGNQNFLRPDFLAPMPPGGMCPQSFRHAPYVKPGSFTSSQTIEKQRSDHLPA